ncbi:protein phosphatase [Sorangium cellulosum]|uniref:Protein phosphatase n=1 Tax=Sorangium cellulosum TaxID=56 RepID=A0A4P2QCS2_SORCE|nr:metallophosphoesterase family protein [Sorangium cellulosum]AUX27201.1 protein phosphatase [Sorangium cellulosum]
MRIALISDIHANEVALRAVMASIEEVGVDHVVCLGDVATLGPRPGATLDVLRELGCPCILGNHDEFLLEPALIRTYTDVPIVVDAVDWCRDQLSGDDLAFLRTFQARLEIPLDAGATLLLFHGSPRSHMENLLADTPPEELDRALAGHAATVMAGGHTHIQMLRQHRGTLLVNPGSVGLPFKEFAAGGPPTLLDHAEYATVEARRGAVQVTLHRVPVDREALREAARACDNPMRGALLRHYA